MAVAPSHLLGRVADPFVDESLIDRLARTGGDEAVTRHMPAAKHFPFPVRKRPLEVIVGLVLGERQDARFPPCLDGRQAALQGRRPRLVPLVPSALAPLLAARDEPALAEE